VRRTISALLLAWLAQAGLAHANTWGIETTGFWYADGEPGWAVNVDHQGEIVFLTLYVYDQSGNAVWYSATAPFASSAPSGLIFSGDLYQTKGPWFGAPGFDPGNVSYRKVGAIDFVLQTAAAARLSYTIDNVAVEKQLQRFTFRSNNLSGAYYGGNVFERYGCSNPAGNGRGEWAATIQIAHSSEQLSIALQTSDAGSCLISGTYVQHGRVGQLDGEYSCSSGEQGTLLGYQIEANRAGFTMEWGGQFTYQGVTCNVSGRTAGVRR